MPKSKKVVTYPPLPSLDSIRKEYETTRTSWTAIGDRYGITHHALIGRLKRDAAKHGKSWPVEKAVKVTLRRDDSVSATFLVMEVKDFCTRHKMPYTEFAKAAGINVQWLYNVLTGLRTQVKRDMVEKIVTYTMEADKELR